MPEMAFFNPHTSPLLPERVVDNSPLSESSLITISTKLPPNVPQFATLFSLESRKCLFFGTIGGGKEKNLGKIRTDIGHQGRKNYDHGRH